MSKSHRRDPGPQVSPRVRELLRANRGSVEIELALQRRERDVLLTVPKIAWEEYQEVPGSTTVRYLPHEHALVVELPEPDAQAAQTRLAGWGESTDGRENNPGGGQTAVTEASND